jgi:uncharacterized protein (DUF2344 family)
MKLIKKYHKWRIDKEQEKVNQLLESEGFTDEVLERQVAINKKRAKHNIVDESKIIHDKYVQ